MSALTREHIKALRAADSAVFCFDTEDDAGDRLTNTHIRLSKEVERGDGFGRETLHVELPTTARVINYGGHGYYGDDVERSVLGRAKSGCWVLLSVKFKAEWATFVSLVHAGDELCQIWTVDNRNTLLVRAGLTLHELAIVIERPAPKDRVKRLHFMLDAGTHAANNLAEPIRRAPVPAHAG